MMKILKVCLWVLLFMTAVPLGGNAQTQQKIYIESFTHDPLDQAAKNHPKTDSNGDLYSVVKVRPVSAAFNFRFGMMKCIVDTQPHSGETWLYVQKNARRISIERDGFEPIMNVDLGITLEAGATYILQLSYVEPTQVVQKQILQFIISPADCQATVKVRKSGTEDYELWGQADAKGTVSRILECGRYEYQIVAENFFASEGVAMLNTPNKTLEEKVTLVQNLGVLPADDESGVSSTQIGWLQVEDEYGISGAQIYVNDKFIGTIPLTKYPCVAGTYSMSIANGELYKTFTTQLSIVKGETTVLKPKLESLAGETRLVVDADAEIYIDKELKGVLEWTGLLKEGRYEVECRMESHEPTVRTIEVKADMPQTIQLEKPKPITGTIAIATTPSYATVLLDGKDVGQSPMVLESVLIGQHRVELSLDGYNGEVRTVDVKKGEIEEIQLTFHTTAIMTISSAPAGANLYVDGKLLGKTPYTAEMISDDHDVKLTKRGYQPIEQRVHLDASHPSESFALKRLLVCPTTLYLQPTFQAGQLMSFGGAVGGYIANVNIEAAYLVGMSPSETVYWNNPSSSQQPKSEQLKPSYMGGKLGYGIQIGRRMRLTPQVGAGVVNVKGDVSAGNAIVASAGVRFECMIVSRLGVSLAPEYGIAVKKSETFEQLSAVSSTIKGWGSGFNARIGIFFCL